METQESVSGLINEYRSLFDGLDGGEVESLKRRLVTGADWTPQAAEHLLQLANNYGSFMLRNALAIAIALKVDDGDLGF